MTLPDDESDLSFDCVDQPSTRSELHTLRSTVSSPPSDPASPPSLATNLSSRDISAMSKSFIGLGSHPPVLRSTGSYSTALGSARITASRHRSLGSASRMMSFGPADVFVSPKPRRKRSFAGGAAEDSSQALYRKANRRVRLMLTRAFM